MAGQPQKRAGREPDHNWTLSGFLGKWKAGFHVERNGQPHEGFGWLCLLAGMGLVAFAIWKWAGQ
jgi:hypothetical protein